VCRQGGQWRADVSRTYRERIPRVRVLARPFRSLRAGHALTGIQDTYHIREKKQKKKKTTEVILYTVYCMHLALFCPPAPSSAKSTNITQPTGGHNGPYYHSAVSTQPSPSCPPHWSLVASMGSSCHIFSPTRRILYWFARPLMPAFRIRFPCMVRTSGQRRTPDLTRR
jgi:hypothetical protein